MKYSRIVRTALCILLLAFTTASAEVTVTVDHNDADHATAEFNFKQVPPPAKTSAASHAKFAIVDGDRDDNGGDLDVLNDGKLPTEQDQPAANFFFNAGTEGGRLSLDLGSAIDVKQVNTYSWHTDTRAPQVYNLYGSDGSLPGFKAGPAHSVDPTTCGWKLLARVDTRPKTGDAGGQYGVSIADSTGSLGKFRYLLLDISRTEGDDTFGNTFFSEINVISPDQDRELLGNPEPAGDRAGVKTVQIDDGKYTAIIDTTETPDLTDWANTDLAGTVAQWFPRIIKLLPSDHYSAPAHFSITFRADKKGVADTAGTRINCAAAFFRAELRGQAKGAIVHEMVHVVQQYDSVRRLNPHLPKNPGWLIEGIPDYIRWYKYEPESHGADISKRSFDKASYDGSYRVSANFLNWAVEKYDKNLIQELNASMREGKYTQDLWEKQTSKSVEELGTEWKTELGKTLGIPPKAAGD